MFGRKAVLVRFACVMAFAGLAFGVAQNAVAAPVAVVHAAADDPYSDSDGDGVFDDQDACPGDPGSANYQGCPAPDSDGDGLNDENDACPLQAGPYDGCPLPDYDGDGVYDDGTDKCPDAAGPADNGGCPLTEVTPAPVVFDDRCGTSNDTATVPTTTGVVYYYLGKPVAAGRYPVGGTITVEARAADGYRLTGTTTWSATFSAVACRAGVVVVTSPAKNAVRVVNRETVALTITSGRVSGRVGPKQTVSFYAPTGTYAYTAIWAADYSPAKGQVRVR